MYLTRRKILFFYKVSVREHIFWLVYLRVRMSRTIAFKKSYFGSDIFRKRVESNRSIFATAIMGITNANSQMGYRVTEMNGQESAFSKIKWSHLTQKPWHVLLSGGVIPLYDNIRATLLSKLEHCCKASNGMSGAITIQPRFVTIDYIRFLKLKARFSLDNAVKTATESYGLNTLVLRSLKFLNKFGDCVEKWICVLLIKTF